MFMATVEQGHVAFFDFIHFILSCVLLALDWFGLSNNGPNLIEENQSHTHTHTQYHFTNFCKYCGYNNSGDW